MIHSWNSLYLTSSSLPSLDAGHQQMVTMWQQMHSDMKGLLSWQYLMKDITVIRSWNITMVSPLFTVMIWALTL